MPNALDVATPPPPNMPSEDQQNQSPAQSPQAATPAPDHNQTVAALRHVHQVGQALRKLVTDPELGKADLKSKIIDAATKLVSDRIMQPAAAVQLLADAPAEPFKQKQWLQMLFMQNYQMGAAVLAHHADAFAGQPPQPTPKRDNHFDDLRGMMQSHYRGR